MCRRSSAETSRTKRRLEERQPLHRAAARSRSCARRFGPMAEGWIISARVVVNDLLTDSGHCWQRFATAIARKLKLVRAYGKPGIWNADSLFADRWSRAVLLSAGDRGNSSVVSLGVG